MKKNKITNSGNLELYILGDLPSETIADLDILIARSKELQQEKLEIEKALEAYAFINATTISEDVKPFLSTMINYTERIKNGEKPTTVPSLSKQSKILDFKPWLDREDLQESPKYDSMYGHIIGATENRKTLIVWLKDGAPPEVHSKEIEKFLIVEGSCEITIGEETHPLVAGNFIEIPLFISHHVLVTSKIRCKIILERSAA